MLPFTRSNQLKHFSCFFKPSYKELETQFECMDIFSQSYSKIMEPQRFKIQSPMPLIRNKLGRIQDKEQYQFIQKIQQLMILQIPEHTQNLRDIYIYLQYPEKNYYSYFLYELTKQYKYKIDENVLNLALSFELLNIAVFLHLHVGILKSNTQTLKPIGNIQGNKTSSNFLERIFQNYLYKQMNDKKLVLAGDFFHTKASVFSSNIMNMVEIPYYFAKIEEDQAKAVYLAKKITENHQSQSQNYLQLLHQYNFYRYGSTFGYAFLILNQINQNTDLLQEKFNFGSQFGINHAYIKCFEKINNHSETDILKQHIQSQLDQYSKDQQILNVDFKNYKLNYS